MAITVTVNGTDYSIPTVGEVGWGATLTAYLQAIAGVIAAATTSSNGSVRLSRAAASASTPIVICSTGGTIASASNDVGLDVTGSGSGAGITATAGSTATNAITGTATGSNNGITGTATSGRGVYGQATTGKGVYGTGTSGVGVYGDATTGNAVEGSVAGAGRGGYFHSSTGIGLEVIALANRAAVISGDGSSPAFGALRVAPQDAEPTGPNLVGDMYVTVAGVLKICTVAGTPGTWVSVGAQ